MTKRINTAGCVGVVVYIFVFVMALGAFGINMSILLGGAAALLVGIGLGLQQTFNDFISGIVLLFERSVSVGDVVVFDNVSVKPGEMIEVVGNVEEYKGEYEILADSITVNS